jgi:hypothetical protein
MTSSCSDRGQSSLMDGRLVALARDPEPRQRGSKLESDPEGVWVNPAGGRQQVTIGFIGNTAAALVAEQTGIIHQRWAYGHYGPIIIVDDYSR